MLFVIGGYAKEYVLAMWQILQHEMPDDFVLATGKTHTVRKFVELTFKELDIEIHWQGDGVNEVGQDAETGQTIVVVNPNYFRLTEVELLMGDSSKAKKELGWEPKTDLEKLVKIMVQSDWKKVRTRGY